MPINQNQALYAAIGTTYGGDGRTTFALPDLRGRTPVGTGQGLTNDGKGNLSNILPGQRRGDETTLLKAAQIPPLSGTLSGVKATSTLAANPSPASAAPAQLTNGGTAYLTNAAANGSAGLKGPYTAAAPTPGSNQATIPVTTTVSDGTVTFGQTQSQAVPTVPPQLGLTACIATIGTFPMRP